MKTNFLLGALVMVIGLLSLGCNRDEEIIEYYPEHLKGIEHLQASGVWEGGSGTDFIETFAVEFDHHNETDAVISVERLIVDDYHSEYTFFIGDKISLTHETSEVVNIEYLVKVTGSHHLNLYYEQEGLRKHFGKYEFAINN